MPPIKTLLDEFVTLPMSISRFMPLYLKKPPRARGKAEITHSQPASANVAQSEVHGDRRKDCRQREQALAKGESEKDAFSKIPDFLIDFDFYADGTKTADFVKPERARDRIDFAPYCSFGVSFSQMIALSACCPRTKPPLSDIRKAAVLSMIFYGNRDAGVQYPNTLTAFFMFSRTGTENGQRFSQAPHCTHSSA